MNRHLNEHQIDAALAGLELGAEAREHLELCLSCRRRLSRFEELVARRRVSQHTGMPDWEASAEAVLARLPALPEVVPIGRRRRLRPLLAVAAAILVAVAIGVVGSRLEGPGSQREVAAEEILAEVDATLDASAVPGFEALEPIVPGQDDLESYYVNGAS